MANKDDKYIAEVMAQKKALGIDCPAIDSIEIVEINGMETSIVIPKKEEKKMEQKTTKFSDMDNVFKAAFDADCLRIIEFFNRIKDAVSDFYDVYDEPNKSAASERYMLRKEGQINGMCETFEILFHTRVQWGRDGVKFVNVEEVK